MTELLLDVDSKIPNLALMKVSRWVKGHNDEVRLVQLEGKRKPITKEFKRVWISVVFTWHRELALEYKTELERDGTEVFIGGTGISLITKLPPEIEILQPDYELYGDDRAIGFVQRGCVRKCEFCVVPQKEGRLADNPYHPVETWVPEGFYKVCLLDNEFAEMPYQQEVIDTCRSRRWKLSITQGYDLRSTTPERAKMLAEWKPWDIKFKERRVYGAWDYFAIEGYVRKGIENLLNAGFKGRELMIYCLAGFSTSHAQDYYRFKVLWEEYNVLPFIMRYNLRKDDEWLNAFSRYVNRGPASYRNHSLLDYMKYRKSNLVEYTEKVVKEAEAPDFAFHNKQPEMRRWYQ